MFSVREIATGWEAIDNGWEDLAPQQNAMTLPAWDDFSQSDAPRAWESGELLSSHLVHDVVAAPPRPAKNRRIARVAASETGEAILLEAPLAVAAPRSGRAKKGQATRRRRAV